MAWLTRSHSQHIEGVTLIEMIEEDLIAERVAIDSYREGIAYLADTTIRRMLEDLASEEEHATLDRPIVTAWSWR